MFNIKPFHFKDRSDNKEKLVAVLEYFKKIMIEIFVESRRDISNDVFYKDAYFLRVIDDKVYEKIQEAWPMIESRLEKAKNAISEMNNETGSDHGLMGPELAMKLQALEWASNELLRINFHPSKEVGSRKNKRILGVLKKNFDIIETIIDSILEATKIGTALKEIVKTVSHAFKDFNKR